MTRFAAALARPLLFAPAIVVAVLAAGGAAFFTMQSGEAAATATAPDAKPEGGRDRSCDACGQVQTIRRTDPASGLPVYEFTVRMRDGSTRDSSQATRGRWIEGDRVIVIGGRAARALEEENNAAP
jgi:hypothetical protein